MPLRVPLPSGKPTQGWWERAVRANRSAKDYHAPVCCTSSASQERAEANVTARDRPTRCPWGHWEPRLLRAMLGRGIAVGPVITPVNDCIRVLVPWLSKARGRDGVSPSLCFFNGVNWKLSPALTRCCFPLWAAGDSLSLQGRGGLSLLFNPAVALFVHSSFFFPFYCFFFCWHLHFDTHYCCCYCCQ